MTLVCRDCTGHTRADVVLCLAVLHCHLGGDGGYEVHNLFGRGTTAEGQSGSNWRNYLHYFRSEFIQTQTCKNTHCLNIKTWLFYVKKMDYNE